MASTLHLPRPRSAAIGGNRDENDALRPYVDAISTMFVRIREKGYNFSAVADCIEEEEIGLKKHEPTQIFSWLLKCGNSDAETPLEELLAKTTNSG
ncbi:436_t:CDS:2 [Cetraspora pellucida]|uniref:436_t:CDS:1 n=1 Tax=Cetraspora pellucida TaxID=1433469 RepID=A0ACA9KBN5_9GLOM|nr:436_t:CDS:2 [Cetraspora pellucida]